MNTESLAFFDQLVGAPSVSGFEEPVQRVVREFAGRYADEVRTDVHGNVIALLNPGGQPRVLFDGHCDQIGLMIQYIDENGFLYVLPVGGWDAQILLGQSVSVWTARGPVAGVIARKAPHLLKDEERKTVPDIAEMWVDIGAANAAQAAELVAVGDPVTLTLGYRRLQGELVAGPKMDDASGLFVVFDALRRLTGANHSAAVYFVSAVQEEIGLRGAQTAAFGIDPDVGIAVDVTHATDCPTIEKTRFGDVKLGAGPVLFRGPNANPVVFSLLCELADEHRLPRQIKAANRGTSNDANVLQLTRAGVAAGCLGVPNRYMHSPVEMISLADLDAGAELLAQFARRVNAQTSFTPADKAQ